MNKKEYKREFNSDPELLPEIENFILDRIEDLNLSSDKLNDLSLAVAEAAANAIEHGNNSDPTKKVKISVEIETEKIILRFKDEGNGFDIDEVPDPTAPENILKDHGRGIHIMKSFLDDIKYNFTTQGTEVILTMRY